MRFILTHSYWYIDEISPLEWVLLKQLPEIASTDDFEAGSRRLFPSPIAEDEPVNESILSLLDDWDEIVRPELAETFRSDREVVANDLSQAKGEPLGPNHHESFPSDENSDSPEIPEEYFQIRTVQVPMDHTSAWYSALNQARLLLNERFNVTDYEVSDLQDWPTEIMGIPKAILYARTQYDMYSRLQAHLLDYIMTP